MLGLISMGMTAMGHANTMLGNFSSLASNVHGINAQASAIVKQGEEHDENMELHRRTGDSLVVGKDLGGER